MKTPRRFGSLSELLGKARSEWAVRGARGNETERSLVWMLGSPRTGSTWLLNLMRAHPRLVPFDEPGIGYHLGLFMNDVMGGGLLRYEGIRLTLPEGRVDDRQYFFSKAYERAWRPGLRRMILARIRAQMEDADGRPARPIAVIKEPAGSHGADFIFSVLPSSRLLFLMRDPRDVLDSELDAVEGGSWMAAQWGMQTPLSAEERRGFLRSQAHRWIVRTESVQRVYDRLPETQRHMVRYEDLLADTPAELSRIFRWLGLSVSDRRVGEAVSRLSFGSLPEASRGQGKFTRSAAPGAWRENLSTDEQAAIIEIVGGHLDRYGYA